MNANDVALLAFLRERAGADDCVRGLPTAEMASALGISRSTVHLALDRLREVGAIAAEPSTGRTPTTYCLAPQPSEDRPMQPSDNRPTQPSDSDGSLAGGDAPETTSSSDSPTATGSDRTGAQEQPSDSDGSVGRSDGPAVSVIIAATDEAAKLGKPKLDEALKTKLGSQAKRMHGGGVSIESLQIAARYLVGHDMTALDAAHRKAQSDAARVVGDLPTTRPTDAEKDELARLAAESKAGRDHASLSPHLEEELIEVWAFISTAWTRAPLLGPAERAAWHEHLRVLPVGCILWALREIARSGERFAPGWGQVWTVGFPKLHEERVRREMAEWRDRETGA